MLCFVWFMLLHNLGSLVNLLLRFDEEFRVEFLKFAEKLYLSKYPSFAWFHHISLSRTMKKAQRREKNGEPWTCSTAMVFCILPIRIRFHAVWVSTFAVPLDIHIIANLDRRHYKLEITSNDLWDLITQLTFCNENHKQTRLKIN